MAASSGDKVKIHYTGKLDDGTVFDSSVGRDPIEFTLGEGHVIPGFEEAVAGLSTGDKKSVVIPPENAYGPRDEQQVVQVERSTLPAELELKPGIVLQAESPQGTAQLTVVDVAEDKVTLDGNHPLAGQQLTFEIEVVEVAAT